MEAFFVSLIAIFVGEIGDKTQLLALLLSIRFKRPLPIVLGIFVASVSNHILAALLGTWIATHIEPTVLRWALGLSFLAIAGWTLKADNMHSEDVSYDRYSVFAVTVAAFFLAEIGDKTQIATIALAAKYQNIVLVVAGSTLGMLLADVPAVYLGKVASPNFPFHWVRRCAALIFALLGCAILLGLGSGFI